MSIDKQYVFLDNKKTTLYDLFQIVIQEGSIWKTIKSEVRLIHVSTKAALKYSGRILPEWAFHQHEIVADRVTSGKDVIWNVEEHRYTRGKFAMLTFWDFEIIRINKNYIHRLASGKTIVYCPFNKVYIHITIKILPSTI